MENKKNKARPITNRHRYFQMVINGGSLGPNIILSTLSITSLVDLLLACNFVSQKIIQTSLYNLEIIDRGRAIFLQNFDGQLERDSQGIPYWNVYLQTTALVTARCLTKAISKSLFKNEESIDPRINIRPLNDFQQCQREKLFLISNSNFYPGHLSRIVVQFQELLKNDRVKEAIKKGLISITIQNNFQKLNVDNKI